MPPRHSFDVSVVIPLFNKGRYIRAAIDSVVAQSWPAREIIVVDDGSTDDGPEQVRNLTEARIKLVSQENAGPGLARNRGIAEAASEWVAFLDADDLWFNDHLNTLNAIHRAFPDASVVASNYSFDPPRVAPAADAKPRVVDLFSERPALFQTSSVAIRRSVFDRAARFRPFWPGEDVELWARLALDHEIAHSPKPTIFYRQKTGGLMDQSKARLSSRMEMQPIFDTLDKALADKKYAARHSAIARYRDRWLAIFARQALVAGRAPVAFAYLRKRRSGFSWADLPLYVLARLPSPILRSALRLRTFLRRHAPGSGSRKQ